ncbi:MAG TPA: MogA/MoaB family molybdenum cofactor biosynthesis protein [Microbacteriaceae bacterium]|nr:MogA/MoaB family molybdenum cofactor biosynthesis protein [Microbacteriaceae bacterium]
MQATVITVSNRSSRGERPDTSGPVAVARLVAEGWDVSTALVPDGAAEVEAALRAALADGARLIVTSGGTGVTPQDLTPEGSAAVITTPLPGIAEEIRRRGAAAVPAAILSRGLAGMAGSAAGGALIVNLPGSPGGVRDGIEVVIAVARHAIEQYAGGDH